MFSNNPQNVPESVTVVVESHYSYKTVSILPSKLLQFETSFIFIVMRRERRSRFLIFLSVATLVYLRKLSGKPSLL